MKRRVLLVSCASSAAWAGLAGASGTGSVLAGGMAVLASVWLFEVIFRAAIITRRPRLATGLVFVKLAAFLAVGWISFRVPGWIPNPVAFAVGVSALPAAAVWEALEKRRR